MSKTMPQIREYMTKAPHIIEADIPLETAQNLMREYGVRHFPVKRKGKLVGVLSERNLTAVLMHGGDYTVQDAMIPDPFVASPHDDLDYVAGEMAAEKYGCAVIQSESGKVEGIFTTVDACRALRELLETIYPQ